MKARTKLDNKVQKKIREEVRAEYDRQGQALSRRHMKLICVALNEHFGFTVGFEQTIAFNKDSKYALLENTELKLGVVIR